MEGAHATVTLCGSTWKRSKKPLHAYAVEGPDPCNLTGKWAYLQPAMCFLDLEWKVGAGSKAGGGGGVVPGEAAL